MERAHCQGNRSQHRPGQVLITNGENTPAHATFLYPLKDKNKDPGYHGEPASQEYLADIYYDIITNWETK